MTTAFSLGCSLRSHDPHTAKSELESKSWFYVLVVATDAAQTGLLKIKSRTNEGQISACRIYERLSLALLCIRVRAFYVRGCAYTYMYTDCGRSVRNKKKDIKWSHVQLLSPHRFSARTLAVYVSAREKKTEHEGAADESRCSRPKMCSISQFTDLLNSY